MMEGTDDDVSGGFQQQSATCKEYVTLTYCILITNFFTTFAFNLFPFFHLFFLFKIPFFLFLMSHFWDGRNDNLDFDSQSKCTLVAVISRSKSFSILA